METCFLGRAKINSGSAKATVTKVTVVRTSQTEKSTLLLPYLLEFLSSHITIFKVKHQTENVWKFSNGGHSTKHVRTKN